MSVKLTYNAVATVEETITDGTPAALDSKSKVTHDQFNTTKTLDGATTPPVTKCAFFTQALTVGSATIDLSALPGTNNAVIDGTGLKVQLIRFKTPTANANPISVDVGASNGYALAGANFHVTLGPGQEITFYGDDDTPDIATTAKELDLSGTGSQTLEVEVVMG